MNTSNLVYLLIEQFCYFLLKLSTIKHIRILAHPMFIALVIALGFFPFLNGFFPKYKAGVTFVSLMDKAEAYLSWIDINNDKESEQITWFSNTQGKAQYKITSQAGFIVDQQGFNGESMTLRNPLYIGDSNGDNLPEVFAFYHRNDSLLLSIVEYSSDSKKTLRKELYITHVNNKEGKTDYSLDVSFLEDLDSDSIGELIFSVYAGYPIVPRSIFIYNLRKGELIQSKFTGATTSVACIIDLNNDGSKELITGQYAPGNLNDSLIDGVSDNFVRLLVYDQKLNLVFKPYLMEGKLSGLQVLPVMFNNQYYLAALFSNAGINENHATILLFDNKGRLQVKKKIQNSTNNKSYCFIPLNEPGDFIHLLDNTSVLTSYNFSLDVVKTKEYPFLKGTYFDQIDIDKDGTDEFIFCSYLDQYLHITRYNLSYPVRIYVPHDESNPRITLKKNRNKPDELSVQFGRKYFLIAYEANPWYPFRLIAWLLMFGMLSGFIFFIQFLQRLALREKYRTERKVSELQLLLMRNQINPHFLFNAINSISYSLVLKNPEGANASIIRLSRLIRSNLLSTDKLSRSLKEELEAATAYLEIVCSQSEEQFSFKLDISTETDSEMQVPVMVIQNYLENAVKHGIRSLGSKGKICININQESGYLRIEISDNGIGRQMASLLKDKANSTGKGMGLMQQFFDEVNKYNEHKISATINDLYSDDGSPAGTRVNIEIPVNMKYRIYEK